MKAIEERDGDQVFAARIGQGLRELDGLERAPEVSADVLRRLGERTQARERSPYRWLALAVALLAIAVTATLIVGKNGERESAGKADAVATAAPGGQDPQSQDPVGPWRLVYEVTVDDPSKPSADGREQGLEQRMPRLVDDLQRRVGALAVVARGDGTMITVVFAKAAAGDVATARALLENPGRFEMRAVADGDYIAEGVRFELAKERKQLQAWLDRGGRERLQRDPRAIAEYRAISEHLRWAVHFVRPDAKQAEVWDAQYADLPTLGASTVAAHAASDWNGGKVPEAMMKLPVEQRFLVELLAVNLHERHFGAADLDPASVETVVDPDGAVVVAYRVRAAAVPQYAAFSERLIGKCCALIWNDEVLAAPRFISRIGGGDGRIHALPTAQASTIARVMATPVAGKLRLLRSERDTKR